MRVRVREAVTKLLLLSCGVAVSIKILSPGASPRPDPEARPAPSLHDERGGARLMPQASPVSVPAAPEPAAQAGVADFRCAGR